MNNIEKQNKIFKNLMPAFKNSEFTDFDIYQILIKYSVEESDFYYFFPYKTKSLCKFYISNIIDKSIKNNKKKFKAEKSISKNILSMLNEFIIILDQEKNVSFFFLDYLIRKPLLFNKVTYNLANNIWRSINDPSVDFNFYTKRFILSQIFINTLIHYKGSKNVRETLNFTKVQINALGKFGYYKFKIKGYIDKLPKTNFLSKFDFMH